MNREALTRGCERGLVGLMIAILIFAPLAFGAVRLQEFLVVQLLVMGLLGVWLIWLWTQENPKLLLPPVCWPVLAFAVYAGFRYATCDVEYVGRQEWLRVLVYTVIFFVAVTVLHRQESIQVLTYTLIGVALFNSFYAAYQVITGSDLVWYSHSGYGGRGSGTYICPNHTAGLLEMVLPLAVASVAAGRGKAVTKIVIGYAALAMVAGLAATASRGGWVAGGVALVGVGVMLALQRPFRWVGLALLGVMLLGGVAAVKKTDFFQRRIDKAFAGGKVDFITRQSLWETAYRMWQDHPWLGVGPGHYEMRFRQYRSATVQLSPDRVHNDYLNTLTDWGVVGAGLVLTVLAVFAVGYVKIWNSVRRSDRTLGWNFSDKFAFVLGAGAGLLALAIHSAVDFNLHMPANAIVAVTLLALLTSHARFVTEQFWFSVRPAGRVLVTLVGIGLLGYLAYQEVRLGREVWHLRQARAQTEPLDQAEALQRAYAIEPRNGVTAHEIAEIYRVKSFAGKAGYAELAEQAMLWYQRGITNNPHYANNYLRWGSVLDFLNRHDEAKPLFSQADAVDPNGAYTASAIGRHYLETGEYAAARPWFERSLRLWWQGNELAADGLRIANERMLQAAQDPVLQKLREAMRGAAE